MVNLPSGPMFAMAKSPLGAWNLMMPDFTWCPLYVTVPVTVTTFLVGFPHPAKSVIAAARKVAVLSVMSRYLKGERGAAAEFARPPRPVVVVRLVIADDEAVVRPEEAAPNRLIDARGHAADAAVHQADDARAVDRLDPVKVTGGDRR